MLVHVKILQFQDMLNESERYCDETNGLLPLFVLSMEVCFISYACKSIPYSEIDESFCTCYKTFF